MIENFLKSEDEVEERRNLQGHLKTLQDENYRLRKYEEAAKANLADSSVNETQLKNSLTKAYRDVVSGPRCAIFQIYRLYRVEIFMLGSHSVTFL